MADSFTFKQDDTWPPLDAVLSDTAGAVNLTSASVVRLILRGKGDPLNVIDGACTITAPTLGAVRYVWSPADTAVADTYDAEFEVLWGDGTIETFPNDGYFTVTFMPDLD